MQRMFFGSRAGQQSFSTTIRLIVRIQFWIAIIAFVVTCSKAQAQISYPMIMSLKPVAVQAGATSECEVNSRYTMLGTYRISVGGTGVTAEPIPPEMPPLKEGEKPKEVTKLKIKFTAEADALPGVREFRLGAPNGASTIGQLVVVRDPVLFEPAENNSADKAQVVTLPAVMCGAIEKAEDVDFWKFNVEAGQTVAFHVRCQRLQDKIHDLQAHADPILFLRDAKGHLISMSDNVFFADPFLVRHFEQTGEYLLEIRDVRYQGNNEWTYCIEANSRPFVTGVFPKAVRAGVETSVELSGIQLQADPHGIVQIAGGTGPGLTNVGVSIDGQVSNPVGVYVTDLPIFVEGTGENDSVQTANAIDIPQVVAGRIEKPMDLDCYSFTAKKGEKFAFEVIARRQMSNLDSYLRILNEQNQVMREEDDGRFHRINYADTWLESWEAPADGKYIVEIRDGLLRGGSGFEYALQITRAQPYFLLETDEDKTQLTPGTYGSLFVRVVRKHGFAGEVQLHIDGLPPGVAATCGRIPGGKGLDGCISLYAPSDAMPASSEVRVWGTAQLTEPNAAASSDSNQEPATITRELSAQATNLQEYYSPGGGRGHYPVSLQTVAVGTTGDLLAVNVSETEIRLKPGESRKILITLQRSKDIKANITLDFMNRHLEQVFTNSLPEGVTMDGSQSKTLLSGNDSEGYITLKADKSAPPTERQVTSVLASFAINFVMKANYSSPPIFVSVEKE